MTSELSQTEMLVDKNMSLTVHDMEMIDSVMDAGNGLSHTQADLQSDVPAQYTGLIFGHGYCVGECQWQTKHHCHYQQWGTLFRQWPSTQQPIFFFQSPQMVLQLKTIFLKFLCSAIKVEIVWIHLWHLFGLFQQKSVFSNCFSNGRWIGNSGWKSPGVRGGALGNTPGATRQPPSRLWIFWSQLVHIMGLNAVWVN